MRWIALTLAVTATVATVLPVDVSSASRLPGPRSLSTGFNADTLLFVDDQVRTWFPRMQQLDSTWARIPAIWASIAPANPPRGFRPADPGDPNYFWFILDRAVKEAAASRQQVLLTLSAPPAWALGRGAPPKTFVGTWRPNPRAFGAFAHAVAERYSGRFPDPARPGRALPRVRYFSVWNEPNLPSFLAPQWTRTRRGFVPASPAIYRRLLNAAYANIKSAQPRAYVLAAGLAPYGDPPGTARMHPVVFLRELLCLRGAALRPEKCPDPARFDAIDIHPYAPTPTHSAANPDDVSAPNIGRLSRVLAVAIRTRRVRPVGPKPIWSTEIGWDSSPPDPAGVPLAREARYLSRTLYELWRQGVSHVMWYEAHDLGAPARFEPFGGLFFESGVPKPVTIAFRFPFVALRARDGTVTLWGRAPVAGRVTIEAARRGGWRRVAQLGSIGGVFDARRRLRRGLTLRARVGSIASYPWSTG